MSAAPRLNTAVLSLHFRALQRMDWEAAERSLLSALARERAGSVVPDGYRTGGSRSEARHTGVSDPTATVAIVRGEPGAWRSDPHRSHTLGAVDELRQLIDAYNRLCFHLYQVARLADPDSERMPDCQACAAGGVHHQARHWGTVGGRLRQPTHVCKQVYEFVRRHGRLPTADEAKAHERTGRWRVVISSPERRPR
jgi:hypothetical protein